MKSVEDRLAALERWRDAMVAADLAEVERDDPARAGAIRATGLLRRDFERMYLFNTTARGLLVACLTCGESTEASRLAEGPVQHLASCPLAPKRPGDAGRWGHG
jgi:hypothetical protein